MSSFIYYPVQSPSRTCVTANEPRKLWDAQSFSFLKCTGWTITSFLLTLKSRDPITAVTSPITATIWCRLVLSPASQWPVPSLEHIATSCSTPAHSSSLLSAKPSHSLQDGPSLWHFLVIFFFFFVRRGVSIYTSTSHFFPTKEESISIGLSS